MKPTTARRLYRGTLFLVSALCLCEGLTEWAFTIPFRRHYFPNQRHPYETVQVGLLLLASAICLVEGASLLVYRRLSPAA